MSTTVSSNLWIRFFQWLVFACLIGYGFGWIGTYEPLAKAAILSSSQTVDAKVTSFRDPGSLSFATLDYTYTLGGKTFSDSSPISAERAKHLMPGQHLRVSVSITDPAVSTADVEALRDSGYQSLEISAAIELVFFFFFWGPVLFARSPRGSLNLPKGNLLAGLTVSGSMLLVGLVTMVMVVLPDFAKASELLARPVQVHGQIMSVYGEDYKSQRATYVYVVDGSSYSGEMDFKGGIDDRAQILVCYLAKNPGYSSTDPAANRKQSITAVTSLSVWNALALAFFLFLFVLARRKPAVEPGGV